MIKRMIRLAHDASVLGAGICIMVTVAMIFGQGFLVCILAFGKWVGMPMPQTVESIRQGLEILVYLAVIDCSLVLSAMGLRRLLKD